MWPIFRSILPAFAGGFSKPEEQRDISLANITPTDAWAAMLGHSGGFPTSVTMKTALSVPAVWAAVKVISDTLASLPLDLFKKTDSGSEPATAHPVRYLIRTEPSDYITTYDFRRALFARACFGDAFARIHRNGIGRPVKLELMTGGVYVSQSDSGTPVYVWEWSKGNKSGRETLLPFEVLHIKGFTLDAMTGLDVSVLHRETLGFAISANEYGNRFFSNNAGVDKVVTYPFALTTAQQAQLATKIEAKSGVAKVGGTMVLDAGMDMKRIGLSPEEAMLNDSRTFQVNEVSRVFGVPVHLLNNMDRATFNNIEMMTTLFVTLCLRPWAVQFEQEMLVKLLTRDEKQSDNYFFRHNFEGLLRGDTAARASFYASGILNGWMTRNEVREKENMNIIKGLDDPLVPVNMSIIDEDGEIKTTQAETQTPTDSQAGAGGQIAAEDGNTDEPAAA